MATFKAVKNRTQSAGAMRRVLDYAEQEKKTAWEDRQLVTGWNCVARSALEEMTTTKQRFQKTEGRLFYQFVQSFNPEEHVTPEEVHAISLELAEKLFPEFEVVVATHTDTSHLHSHLIVNSVSFVDGHKLHQNAADLQRQREISDEICAAHGLTVLEPAQRYGHGKGMKSGEYRSAARGESWKIQMMNTIDLCMGRARTRKEFIREMERRGYRVRWEDGRKSITYTTPEGKRCRDVRLHDRKYLKEVMEYEFRIREEIVPRGVEEIESVCAGDSRTRFGVEELGRAVEYGGRPGLADTSANEVGADDTGVHHQAADGDRANGSSDGGSAERGRVAPEPDGTGWEAERAEAFAGPADAYVHAADLDALGGSHGIGDVAGAAVRLGRAIELNSMPPRDATTIPHHHGDRKALAKEREKKIAMGQKADDHEDEQIYGQTM